MSLYLILVLAFTLSLAVTGFMVFAGIGDVPVARSSHKHVTPTGGGLGIIAAMGIAGFVLAASGYLTPKFAQVLSLIWAMGFLGFMDDVLNLAAKFKFFFMAIITVAAVWTIGPVTHLPFGGTDIALPVWFAWGGSCLWIFVVVNVVNFLDGSNGIMIAVMGIASAVLGAICFALGAIEPGILSLVLLAGLGGLAPYNFRPNARIFAGDVGALTTGFTYGISALWLCSAAADMRPVYIGPVLILPFLADSLFTMLRRALARENLMTAHRSHLYQRMISRGFSHIQVAVIYGVLTMLLGALTLWAVSNGLYRYMNFLVFPALILSSAYMFAGRRFN